MNKKEEELVLTLIDAYSNPVRSNILMYLKMKNKGSVAQISKHLGKTKPTISSHIKKLVETRLLREFTDPNDNERGSAGRLYYELNSDINHDISGKKLEKLIKDNPIQYKKSAQQLLAVGISHYKQLEHVVSMSIKYLEKMNQAIQSSSSPETISNIMKDHAGRISLDYIGKTTALTLINEGLGVFDNIKTTARQNEAGDNPYLLIRAILPILRIMEMENEDEWKIDGNIWA